MPFYWKRKALLARTETTYGTDAAPTAATHAILAIDVSLNPMEGQDISRNLERPFLGGQAVVPVDLHAKLSFKVELQASGTLGTAPAWGPLIRACGCAQVISAGASVTYNPVSEAHESVTLHLHIDGIRYVLTGARGTCKITVNASGIPYLEFEFTGLFVQPTAQALPVPVTTAFQIPQVATRANTPTFTLGGVSQILRSYSLDFGNAVEPRFLIGSDSILITDRAEKVDFTIEQDPLATFNPFSLAAAGTTVACVLTHGTVAGRRATINVPAMQIARPSGLQQAQNIVETPLSGMPLPVTGNDQFTLVLT